MHVKNPYENNVGFPNDFYKKNNALFLLFVRIESMKKNFLLSIVLLFSSSTLLGCSPSVRERLTFGTLYHETSVEIDTDTCYSKKENENFFLVTYEDTTCGCWTYFSRVLDYLSKYNNILSYKINNKNIDDRLNEFGIKNSSDPAFYIIANKKVIRRAFYTDNSSLFTDEKVLYNVIKETIGLPYMYFINEEQIQTEVVDKGGIIYYTRLTCPDCSYCTPHVVMPHIKKWIEPTNKIYVYDMDPIRNGDPEAYQKFKDDHYLSNKYNNTFGYLTGFVPTFQYYKDGELYDMAVYFNDEITDGTITTSYYDEERAKHTHYTVNLIRKVLVGTVLGEYELSVSGDWKDSEIHSQYYTPFIEAFFDFYFK